MKKFWIIDFCFFCAVFLMICMGCGAPGSNGEQVKSIPLDVKNHYAICTESGTIRLEWTNPDADTYEKIEIEYGNDNKIIIDKNDSPNNSKTLTGFTDGEEYVFKFTVVNSNGEKSHGVKAPCICGTNGGLYGTAVNNQTQGDIVYETWMDSNGNLIISTESGLAVIEKTSEVIAVPKGMVSKISMMNGTNTEDDIFTTKRKLIVKPFVMGRYEVTRELYKAVIGTDPSDLPNANGNVEKNPVACVNYFEVIIFCNKLSMKFGLKPVYSYVINGNEETDPDEWIKEDKLGEVPNSLNHKELEESGRYLIWKDGLKFDRNANGYRLPTRVEWEFCAGGGNPNIEDWTYYFSGSNDYSEVGWFGVNESHTENQIEGTKEVGEGRLPNKLNIYDMSGNVWELTNDTIDFEGGNGTRINNQLFIDEKGYFESDYYFDNHISNLFKGSSYQAFDGSTTECMFQLASPLSRYDYYASIPYNRSEICGIRLVRSL